jgi:hypothetical protein
LKKLKFFNFENEIKLLSIGLGFSNVLSIIFTSAVSQLGSVSGLF